MISEELALASQVEDSHNLNNEIKSLLIVKLIDAISRMTKSLGKAKKRNKHLKKLGSTLEDKISALFTSCNE